MLINIVGIDGVGKSTQTNLLKEWIKNNYKVKVRIVSKWDLLTRRLYPECSFIKCTREELGSFYYPRLKGYSRAIFIFWMTSLPFCKFPPEKNEIVIVDSYWHKHLVTEKLLGIDETWIQNLCRFFPNPDISILIDMRPEEVLKLGHRIKPYEAGIDFSCSRQSFLKHQESMRKELFKLAEKERWIVIEGANKNLMQIFEEIKNQLLPYLNHFSKRVKG